MAIGARSELTRGITLEQAAHFRRTVAVLDGEVADRVPALARGLEQALAGERGQSAPHGSPRYTQALGDCGLGNARAGREHALDDQFPDALSYRAVHSPPSLDRIKNSLAGGSIARRPKLSPSGGEQLAAFSNRRFDIRQSRKLVAQAGEIVFADEIENIFDAVDDEVSVLDVM